MIVGFDVRDINNKILGLMSSAEFLGINYVLLHNKEMIDDFLKKADFSLFFSGEKFENNPDLRILYIGDIDWMADSVGTLPKDSWVASKHKIAYLLNEAEVNKDYLQKMIADDVSPVGIFSYSNVINNPLFKGILSKDKWIKIAGESDLVLVDSIQDMYDLRYHGIKFESDKNIPAQEELKNKLNYLTFITEKLGLGNISL